VRRAISAPLEAPWRGCVPACCRACPPARPSSGSAPRAPTLRKRDGLGHRQRDHRRGRRHRAHADPRGLPRSCARLLRRRLNESEDPLAEESGFQSAIGAPQGGRRERGGGSGERRRGGAHLPVRARPCAPRRCAGSRQDAAGEGARAGDAHQIFAYPVHARPDARGHRRHHDGDRGPRAAKEQFRFQRAHVRPTAARRRDQPRDAEDPVGAARGDAGTAR
jgi:hypothetical protein